jgi:hypothetical protein
MPSQEFGDEQEEEKNQTGSSQMEDDLSNAHNTSSHQD